VQLPPVFISNARHPDDAPDAPLAGVCAQQHGDQLAGVEAIALGAAGAAIDCDARGVDHVVRDPARAEIAVQPEPIAPGFIATPHRCVSREPEMRLGPGELPLERYQVARRDGAHQRELIEARRAS